MFGGASGGDGAYGAGGIAQHVDFGDIGLRPIVGAGGGGMGEGDGAGVGGPIEFDDMAGRVGEVARGAFALRIGFGGDDPDAVVFGVFVDDAEIALLFLGLFLIGAGFDAGESDGLAIGRNMECANLAFPIGEHFGIAAIDGDAIQVRLAAALGGEVEIAAVGGELGGGGALVAASQLGAMRTVGGGQKNLGYHLALCRFEEGTAFGRGHRLAVGGGKEVAYGLSAHGDFGSPCGRGGGGGGSLAEGGGGQENWKQVDFHGMVLCKASSMMPTFSSVDE